jgi:BirA family transcriptional regulator, biotin operon repressor / biotin---[acetyl-CoA-carboxylase] ligase
MALNVSLLREQAPALNLHYLPTVGSTMTEASRLSREGAAHGTVVVADEQTAGLGRMGRSWTSEPEVGIYCSVILRLPLPQSRLPIVSLLLGLATAEAIQNSTGIACDLRWPNDVLVAGRKVAGVLAHLTESCIIAGIGINVNNSSFDPNLRTPATSLLLAGSREISRETVLLTLLESLAGFCNLLTEQGPASILRAFTAASSYVVGRRVCLEEDGAVGTTAGLDENGFLRVRMGDGKLRNVASGGIRLV